MFIFKNASNTEKVLLRVNAVPATSSASQLDWRDQSDKQTATDGTIKANIWYTFNLEVLPHTNEVANTLTGKVLEILDYGRTKYAVIDVYGQKLIAAYDGNVGDTVDVIVPVEAVTIKDKSIDIIIV